MSRNLGVFNATRKKAAEPRFLRSDVRRCEGVRHEDQVRLIAAGGAILSVCVLGLVIQNLVQIGRLPMTIPRLRLCVFAFGFTSSCVAMVLILMGIVLSEYPTVVVCLWEQTCEGGDFSIVYTIGYVGYAVLNLVPTMLMARLAPLLPDDLAPFLCTITVVMLVLSGLWWALINFICLRLSLLANKRRAIVTTSSIAMFEAALFSWVIWLALNTNIFRP